MTQGKRPFKNIREKRENTGNQNFFPFPTMFLTLSKKNCNMKLSPANAFSLDWYQILLFGNGLKGETEGNQHSLHFLCCFLSSQQIFAHLYSYHFIMLSGNGFSLEGV